MKIFRHSLAVCIALAAVVLGGCNRPQTISDNELIDIFHDAYLTNAYLSSTFEEYDSVLVYEPILERYGYTIEDLQHSIQTFSERKSALLSDLVAKTYRRLDEESKAEARKVVILDTLDRVAQRTYTRMIYADSLIVVKELRDTSKLRITIDSLVPGEYNVSFSYLIDTLDENRNSRVEAYVLCSDSARTMRHTTMLSRYRESNYSRKFTVDTQHRQLYINMYYHPSNEISKQPDITIRDLEVERVLPAEVSVDSLYHQQLNVRIFNHALMSRFTADTVYIPEPIIEPDSIASYEEADSSALRTY
jgi:hypothetical protein